MGGAAGREARPRMTSEPAAELYINGTSYVTRSVGRGKPDDRRRTVLR